MVFFARTVFVQRIMTRGRGCRCRRYYCRRRCRHSDVQKAHTYHWYKSSYFSSTLLRPRAHMYSFSSTPTTTNCKTQPPTTSSSSSSVTKKGKSTIFHSSCCYLEVKDYEENGLNPIHQTSCMHSATKIRQGTKIGESGTC